MHRWVAFLRGMNLGRRRITNDELRAAFEGMGLGSPTPFLASGNVVFDTVERARKRLAARIESGLAEALGYEVPTFLRSAAEVRAVATHEPFPAERVAASRGKLQVALLPGKPSEAARQEVLAQSSPQDALAFDGRELYWLPSGGILESPLDLAAIESRVGPWTMRTHRTMARLAGKFLLD